MHTGILWYVMVVKWIVVYVWIWLKFVYVRHLLFSRGSQ